MRKKILIFLLLSFTIFANSQTNKIKDLENQRKKALQEIENTNKLLASTKKNTNTLIDRIKLITTQIATRQNVVTILTREIEEINREQKKTEEELSRLEVDLKQKQENYAAAVRGMIHKKQSKNKLFFVLSGKSLGESLRRMKYLRDYSEWRNDQAEEIKKDQKEWTVKKLELEKTKKDKLELLAARRAEQNKLKEEEKARQAEINEANNKQKELQAIIKQKQQQADRLNTQIQKLIAEEIARQEKEAKRIAEEKAKAAGKGNDEKTIKEMMAAASTENLKLSNDFVANKGKFPVPVTGSYTIVTRFGTQRHNQWSSVTTNSNGIDIRTQSGADARAIFQGEVSDIAAIPGSNNLIIVKHGEYFSVYGNIQQAYVKKGQKITTGQSIGKIYTDSDNGLTQLHFQLWKGKVKQNPEPWLKK